MLKSLHPFSFQIHLDAFANHRGDAHQPAPDFAALDPIVARSAEQGNPLATDILRRAGESLANQVALVAQEISVGVAHFTSNLKPRTLESPTPAASSPTLPTSENP